MRNVRKACSVFDELSVDTPLGILLLKTCSNGVHSLSFSSNVSSWQPNEVMVLKSDTVTDSLQHTVVAWLEAYFKGQTDEMKQLATSIRLCSLANKRRETFYGKVYEALCAVPFGQTTHYADLAASVGCPNGWRAVGQAMANNQVALLIPCHRVIEKSGKMGRYGHGRLDGVKRMLLDFEASKVKQWPMAHYTGSIADAGRLIHIAKRRERHKEDIEKQRQKIQAENSALTNIGEKFKAHYDAVESRIKMSTVGLVTLDEMRAKQERAVQERERLIALKEREERLGREQAEKDKKRVRQELQNRSVLSFADEEEDLEEQSQSSSLKSESVIKKKKKKISKDPTVDTSFLPDREREMEDNLWRQQLCEEWTKRQEMIKNEIINIAFSYWDGSGHRRDIKMKKGSSVEQFLQRALELLRRDFNELKTVSTDNLMFVKEDLIIPHFYTFYDFIVTKTMGKTGPLFEFDAAGELRIRQDAMVDTSESHPAKVVLRQWYERNKHIYPASRWEPFDPNKKYNRTTEDLREL